jgi:hypothetical protein
MKERKDGRTEGRKGRDGRKAREVRQERRKKRRQDEYLQRYRQAGRK